MPISEQTESTAQQESLDSLPPQTDSESQPAPPEKPKLRNEWILKRRTLRAAARAVVRRMEEFERKINPKGTEHLLHLSDLHEIRKISPSPERVDALIDTLAAERIRALLVYRVLGVLAEGGITATNVANGGMTDISKYAFLLATIGTRLDKDNGQVSLKKIISNELRAILREISVRYDFEQNKQLIPDFTSSPAQLAAGTVADTEEVQPFILQVAPSIATQLSILTVSGNWTLPAVYSLAAAALVGLKQMRSLKRFPFLQSIRSKILESTVPLMLESLGEFDPLKPYEEVYTPIYFLILRYLANLGMENEVTESSTFMQSVRETVTTLLEKNTTLCTPEQQHKYRVQRRRELLNKKIQIPLTAPHVLTVEQPAVPDITRCNQIEDVTPRLSPDVRRARGLNRRLRAMLTGEQLTPEKNEPQYALPAVELITDSSEERPQAVFTDFTVHLQSGNRAAEGADKLLLGRSSFATEPGKITEVYAAGEQIMSAFALKRKTDDGMCVVASGAEQSCSATSGIETVFCDLKTQPDSIEYARLFFTDYPLTQPKAVKQQPENSERVAAGAAQETDDTEQAAKETERYNQLLSLIRTSGLVSEEELTYYRIQRADQKGLSGGRSELRFKLQLIEAFSSGSKLVVIHKLFDKFAGFEPDVKAKILAFLVAQAQGKVVLISRPKGTVSAAITNPDYAQHIARFAVDAETLQLTSTASVDDMYDLLDQFGIEYQLPVNYSRSAPPHPDVSTLPAAEWLSLNPLETRTPFKSPEELYQEVVIDHTSRLHRMTLAQMREYLVEHHVEVQVQLPPEALDQHEVLFRDIHTVELDIVYTDAAGNRSYLFEESQQRVDMPMKRKRRRRGLGMKYNPALYAAEQSGELPVQLLRDLLTKELSADDEIPLTAESVRKVDDENVLILRDSYLIPTHARTERYEVAISEDTYQRLLSGFTSFSTSRKTIGHYVFGGEEMKAAA